MSSVVMTDLLAKRRDRAIAIILGIKEREIDPHLPPAARAKLRKVILDQLNEFYDLTLDLVATLDRDDVVINDLYLTKLTEIHEAVVIQGNFRATG